MGRVHVGLRDIEDLPVFLRLSGSVTAVWVLTEPIFLVVSMDPLAATIVLKGKN